MSAARKEVVHHQGWLTKSPPSKGIFRPRWRRRWFILKSGSYPNQFVLEYFTDESCRRQKGLINLDECEQINGPLAVQDRHKYTFQLRTPSRVYYLAADTEPEMSKWIKGLCQVCGLKMMDDENDGNVVYVRPSNENTKPEEGTTEEVQNESEENSPTPSNRSPSGPYIPISECFTGKPIIFNRNGSEEVTYYNTCTFPFPPKVNWATHPYMKDSKDESESQGKTPPNQRPTEASYAPPRPPKKSSSKPTSPTTITTPQPKSSCSSKSSEDVQNQGMHSAGVYENVEENPDSSSTSSSLHSPPGSAGGLYCNVPDTSETKTAATPVYQNPQPSTSPTTPSSNSISAIPPKVDRKLKPEVRKANEINAALKNQCPHVKGQSRVGCMTLPNKCSQGVSYPGPEIDRTRKPSDGTLTLGSTPAQKKHSLLHNTSRDPSNSRLNARTNTLPNISRRFEGPLTSPHNKKAPPYHEISSSEGLSGTYMQIECQDSDSTRSQTLKLPNKKPGPCLEESVEYRLIDHVKTKALNQMRVERHLQLQNPGKHIPSHQT